MKTKILLIGSLFIPLTSVGSMINEVLFVLVALARLVGVNKSMNDKQFSSNEMYLGIKDCIQVSPFHRINVGCGIEELEVKNKVAIN